MNQETDQLYFKNAPGSLKNSDNVIHATGHTRDDHYDQVFPACANKTVHHWPVRMGTLLKLVVTLMIMNVVLVLSHVHLQYRVSFLESQLKKESSKSYMVQSKDSFVGDIDHVAVPVKDGLKTSSEQRNNRAGSPVGTTGHTDSRATTKITEKTLVRVARSLSQTANKKKCAGLSMKTVLEDYCSSRSNAMAVKEATFTSVFDRNFVTTLDPLSDPNCISHGGTQEFPEKWCINRLIEYKNQGSLVKVFSGVTNPLISFSNATGNFTVLKSGTFFVYGSIPVISNSSRQLVGVFKNKDILIACPSSGYGIIRPENHGSSTTRRICNMNGVMKLNQNDQLQVKTLENELTIHLDVAATISWILLR